MWVMRGAEMEKWLHNQKRWTRQVKNMKCVKNTQNMGMDIR